MPRGPAARSALGRELASRAARASDVLLRTLYIGTALLGLLVTPPVIVLLLVPGLTVIAVTLLAGFIWYLEQRWPSRRTLVATATATAALIPFSQAVHALQAVGTAISLTVIGLLTVVALAWIDQQSPHAARSAGSGDRVGDHQSLRDLLQVMPLETLLAEWRALDDLLDELRSTRDPATAAVGRALLLHELQRREPVGFSAWLASGATGPPDEHFRDDRGLAA